MISSTVGKTMDLFHALDEIRGQKMNKTMAKAIFQMRNEAKKDCEYFEEQQREILQRMGLEVDGNGRINFGKDIEKVRQFQTEMEELRNVETELQCDPINLSEEQIDLSPAFIEATDGFIIV